VRAEFTAEKRAMEAELKLAHRELSIVCEQIERERKDFAAWFAEAKQARIVKGDPGEPGKPGEPGAMGPAGPAGERGADGEPGRDGESGAMGEPGKPGEAGPIGKPGAEGPAGRDGRDGLPGPIGERGKDGRDGIDGKDGLGFEDARQFHDVANLQFGIEFLRAGDVIRKFTFPMPTLADFHCGPYRNGASYKRGQCATFAGSTWLCLRDTEQKPETEDWRMIVKAGLPGRAGKDGERGAPGPAGRDGRDLTQMTSGGLKYG